MLTTFMALFLSSAPSAVSPPMVDGRILFIGDSCYTTRGSDGAAMPAGRVLRRVERIGRDRLMITVAARFNGGPLLTSRLETRLADLRPITTREEADGRTALFVRYRDGAAEGKAYPDGGGKPVRSTKAFAGPVWDDEAGEFVLTALPLALGAHFELPVFHFERGAGTSRIDVTGERRVEMDGTNVDAWVVEAGTRSQMVITFLVAKADRRLLEIQVGDVRSRLGGDCSGMTK